MKKKKIWIGSVIGILLFLVIVFLFLYRGRKSPYSCEQIPLADGKLSWGMSTDEVIAAVGEPSSIEHEEYGDILTYDMTLPCDFGKCTQANLYIGIDEKAYDGEKFSSGLGTVMFTIDNGSKEAILEELTDFYGELSPDGGTTTMEMQLKEANPDYFYQYHFCEAWRAGTLPEDTFSRLQQVQKTIPDSINVPIEKDAPLMYVNFSGVDGNPCTIMLDADAYTSYLQVKTK